MKKQILFVAVMIGVALFSATLFAQNITLSNASGAVANGALISVHGFTDAALIEAPVYVTNNNTVDTIRLKVRKFIVDTVPGTTNTFCFGVCYGSTVYVSPNPQTLAPGVTLYGTGFDGEYSPIGHEGTTTVRYLIYNINNLTDTASFTVSYSAQLNGVAENGAKKVSSYVYPNPASSSFTLAYDLKTITNNTNLIIRNVLGKTVKEIELNAASAKLNVNTEDLENGIYFYSIVAGGKTLDSKKLIIRH